MQLEPIGIVHSPFREAQGTPLNPAFAKGIRGTVEVFEAFAAGLQDLDGFERIWLIFWFDRAAPTKLITPVYLDANPHGVFATRAPSRPNPLGLSCVKLLSIAKNVLQVEEIDILDGTPLLDIKPYSPYVDVFAVERSGWFDVAMKKQDVTVADNRFFQPKPPE
jgi:tRNA-Thr(GGU) m(6)t(6)A37 methyltransferase TsaA